MNHPHVFSTPYLNNLIHLLCETLSPEAILCYGSYAQGMQDDKSDIDLLIFVEELPSQSVRENIYQKISGLQILTLGDDINAWGSTWTLRNDVLDLKGMKIEPGFNTPHWLKKVVASLMKGMATTEEMLFRPYTILNLLEKSLILFEKNSFITNIHQQIRPFPIALKKAIVAQNHSLMQDNYDDLVTNVDRNIGFIAYQFHVGMFLDTVLQLLFVINDVYDPASKRVEMFLEKLPFLPEGFLEFTEKRLPECYRDRSPLLSFGANVITFIDKKLGEQGLS